MADSLDQVATPIPGTNLNVYSYITEAGGDAVVVTIHGLGGTPHEHIHYNAANTFALEGFSTWRVSLYGSEADARNLSECDVDTHVNDVALVLRRLRSHGRKIALIGHSLGGLVLQRMDRELFDVAVLWDPVDAQQPDFNAWDEAEWRDDFGFWLMHWGADVLVSKAMERSWWHAQPDNHDIGVPTKIIGAGDSWMPEPSQRYAAAQSGPSEFAVVKGADHGFKRSGSQQLHLESISWLRKHLR